MPRLAPEIQNARRGHILDAAERCFIAAGFHATSMDDICREAGVSPGALYTWFASKDDLIIGLCEREKERCAKDLAAIAHAPDLLAALRSMGERYFANEPHAKVRLGLEIAAEAARNEVIGATVRATDAQIRASFADLFARERDAGRIEPKFPIETVVRALSALGDGLFWNRAIDPSFDPAPLIPAMMTMMSALIAPMPSEVRND